MRSEQDLGDLREGGPRGAHLHHDIHAVAVLLDHPLDAPDLAADTLEASGEVAFVWTVHVLSRQMEDGYPGWVRPTLATPVPRFTEEVGHESAKGLRQPSKRAQLLR